MPDKPWVAKVGSDGTIDYRVRLTESGMHIEIEARGKNGTDLGNVWVSRFDWSLVQEMVQQAFTQARLFAQAQNIATDALYGDDED